MASARETCRSHGARTPGPLRRAPPHGTGNTTRAHGLPPTGKHSADEGWGAGREKTEATRRGGRRAPWRMGAEDKFVESTPLVNPPSQK